MNHLQWILWAVAMSLVMRWLARSRKPESAEPGVLRHPTAILIVGVVCGGFFLLLAVLCALFPGKTGNWKIVAFFLMFASVGLLLVGEHRRVWHRLVPGGLEYHTLFGRHGTLHWEDVIRAGWSDGAKWFWLERRGGEVVRISAMLIGLQEFARAVLDGVPRSAIEPDALRVLEETADGRPPNVWG
jgi:hypothetical protein